MRDFKEELEKLNSMVDDFSRAMKQKLEKKLLKGCTGWDNPDNIKSFKLSILEHALKRDNQWVDIANLAAMVWLLDKKLEEE